MDLAVIRKQTRLDKHLRDRGLLEMLSKKLGYKLNFRYKGRPKKGCVPKEKTPPGFILGSHITLILK